MEELFVARSAPFGAKESGEGTQVPGPAAIANAIYDAVGVRITTLPITAEKVLEGLQAKAKSCCRSLLFPLSGRLISRPLRFPPTP